MRSALRQNLPASAGTFSCSRARCYMCSFLNSATSISGPKSNFIIRHNFTCTSSNIIYCISCSKCCKLYIGETGRCLSDRFAEHLCSARNNDVDKPVARHFNATNHSISDIKVCPISSIFGGKRFSLIWSLHSFCFCTACADKSGDFSPFHSIVYVHPPRLLIDFRKSK